MSNVAKILKYQKQDLKIATNQNIVFNYIANDKIEQNVYLVNLLKIYVSF